MWSRYHKKAKLLLNCCLLLIWFNHALANSDTLTCSFITPLDVNVSKLIITMPSSASVGTVLARSYQYVTVACNSTVAFTEQIIRTRTRVLQRILHSGSFYYIPIPRDSTSTNRNANIGIRIFLTDLATGEQSEFIQENSWSTFNRRAPFASRNYPAGQITLNYLLRYDYVFIKALSNTQPVKANADNTAVFIGLLGLNSSNSVNKGTMEAAVGIPEIELQAAPNSCRLTAPQEVKLPQLYTNDSEPLPGTMVNITVSCTAKTDSYDLILTGLNGTHDSEQTILLPDLQSTAKNLGLQIIEQNTQTPIKLATSKKYDFADNESPSSTKVWYAQYKKLNSAQKIEPGSFKARAHLRVQFY